jgi:hypothetical protein
MRLAPAPGILAQETVEYLEVALEQFGLIAEDPREERGPTRTELSWSREETLQPTAIAEPGIKKRGERDVRDDELRL